MTDASRVRLLPGPKPRSTACTKCAVPLTQENSVPARRNRDGLSDVCRDCHSSSARAWQAANPERVKEIDRRKYRKAKAAGTLKSSYNPERERRKALVRRYGITIEQYEAMVADQGGVCCLCDGAPGKRPLSVDHDHATGKVRGLLCTPCNVALHAVERTTDWMARATSYLKEHAGA